MLSAFYTTTGRSIPIHFHCAHGRAREIVRDANASIEEWAHLSEKERAKCKRTFNLHTQMLAPEAGLGTEEQLELAKKRLKAMIWFGILEYWPESMWLFRQELKTDLSFYTPVFNLNKYNHNISSYARNVLESHNKQDIELYAYATKLLHERLNKHQWHQNIVLSCDDNIICWHKEHNKQPNSYWSYNKTSASVTPYEKENIVCGPKMGCNMLESK